MATRQYIGARYVPKFYQNSVDGSANWQSNVVYEPLTYVTLTNGHMYISKKQVPATVGTPASNAEYWLDVGSYNGFIDELQEQIDDIEKTVTVLDNKNYATKKKIIFIGDSYQANYGNNGWCNKVVSALGLTDYKISAAGGASFGGRVGYTQFTTLLNDVLITMSTSEKENITDIIVAGGLNDVAYLDENHTAAELRTAIGGFATLARNNCPNAVIHVGFIGNTLLDARDTEQVVRIYRNCSEIAPNMCYINGCEGAMAYKGYLSNDNVHPNDSGLNSISTSICAYLKNNKAVTNYLLRPSSTAETGIGNLNSFNDIIEKLYYDTFEMIFPSSWGFDSASGVNFAQNSFVDIAAFSNDLLRFTRYPFYINTFVGYQQGSTWTLKVPCVIRLYRGKISLAFFETVNGVTRAAFNNTSPVVANIMDACF